MNQGFQSIEVQSLMRRSLLSLVLTAIVTGPALAQVNPRGTATTADGKVKIDYGRPSAKGRDVLSMISPGTYWRMGADQSTKLVNEVPLVVGEATLAPGEYTLLGHFASAEEFYLVVARSVGDGAEPEDVAAKAKGAIQKGQEHVEEMTLAFEGDSLVLSWAGSRIRMPVKAGK
jgi:hypothetical protein